MSALVQFMLARIAEVEALARDAATDGYVVEGGLRWGEVGHETVPDLTVDPDRLLAECKAKRAILDELEDARQRKDIYNRGYDAGELSTPDDFRFRLDANVRWAAIEGVVRLLAAAYSDHPEHPDDWSDPATATRGS